jgi:hypothetical protein
VSVGTIKSRVSRGREALRQATSAPSSGARAPLRPERDVEPLALSA